MNSTEAMGRFDDIMQKVDGVYDRYARRLGMSNTALYLLHLVYVSGGCTQKQLCDKMLLPKQTVNSIVLSFCKQGLMEMVLMLEDRRQKAVHLTEAGRTYASQVLPPIAEAEKQGMEQFTDEEQAILFRLMEKYADAFAKALRGP